MWAQKKREEKANDDKKKMAKVAGDIIRDVFPEGFGNTNEDKVLKRFRVHAIDFCRSDKHVEIHKLARDMAVGMAREHQKEKKNTKHITELAFACLEPVDTTSEALMDLLSRKPMGKIIVQSDDKLKKDNFQPREVSITRLSQN